MHVLNCFSGREREATRRGSRCHLDFPVERRATQQVQQVKFVDVWDLPELVGADLDGTKMNNAGDHH